MPTLGATPSAPTSDREVLHVVGALTDAVHAFLHPATSALLAAGVPQTVILSGDDRRSATERLDPSVSLIALHRSGVRMRDIAVLAIAVWKHTKRSIDEDGLRAIHAHGLIPAFILLPLGRRLRSRGVEVLVSPHASRLLSHAPWFGRSILRVLRPFRGKHAQRLVVGTVGEARRCAPFTDRAVPVIDAPVSAPFMSTAATPSERPLVLGADPSLGANGTRRFVQLAVLMAPGSEAGLQVDFTWQAPPTPSTDAALEAAGILQATGLGLDARLAALRQAWVVVLTGEMRGFSSLLSEAMAMGIPCIAIDTPRHREIIEDGKDGFLFSNFADLLQRVDQLLQDGVLRARIGQAAREKAQRQFDQEAFAVALLAVYDAHPGVTADASPQVAG